MTSDDVEAAWTIYQLAGSIPLDVPDKAKALQMHGLLRANHWRRVPDGYVVVPDPMGWEQGQSHSFPLSAVEKEK